MCSSGSLLPELLGKPDENSFGAPDVAEPIRVFVLDHFADELRAAFAEPGERIVDVLHGEHDAQVTQSVHRGTAVIGDHRRREESGHLEPAVTVRRTHHGNLDAHVAQSSDAICPVSFDWGAPLELEAKFGEELNGGVDVFYHDADVVHTLDRHDLPWRLTPILPRGARFLSQQNELEEARLPAWLQAALVTALTVAQAYLSGVAHKSRTINTLHVCDPQQQRDARGSEG